MEIKYHVRFNPDIYEASAYSLWETETNTLIAIELSIEQARECYRNFNNFHKTPQNKKDEDHEG